MTRSTTISIDPQALLHNLRQVHQLAPSQQVVAMVKANAYGCGVDVIVPVLDGKVAWFGVACLEEAEVCYRLGIHTPCLLLEGVFKASDYRLVAERGWGCVVHTPQQLDWLLATPLSTPITIWLKVDTGMHRIGVSVEKVPKMLQALHNTAWVNNSMVLMTHFACADDPQDPTNLFQLNIFNNLFQHARDAYAQNILQSMANSAAIFALPEAHGDLVRPGIMLYGVSPFSGKTGQSLGLQPVVQLHAPIIALQEVPQGDGVGYGATWRANKNSLIGVVAIGYGDGYPRHIQPGTSVALKSGELVPIVGRVSMDMLTIDLTSCQSTVSLGEPVELWGNHIPIETIAQSAGTIAYEMLCQISNRPYRAIIS